MICTLLMLHACSRADYTILRKNVHTQLCPIRESSVSLDGQRFKHKCHQIYFGVTLDRTLSYRTPDNRQAEEPKQIVDEANWFHLGRQRQYSAVICPDALLLSSRVLRPSLVTLCSHKLAWSSWTPPSVSFLAPFFHTSPMASSALQHWTASSTQESCHWQAGGENCQTRQLANPAWYPQLTIATTDIHEAAADGLATNWHQKSIEA